MEEVRKQLEKINTFISTIKFLYLFTGILVFLSYIPQLQELTFLEKVVVCILCAFLWLPLYIVTLITKV